jgi:hypothetical protein
VESHCFLSLCVTCLILGHCQYPGPPPTERAGTGLAQ